MHDSQMRNLIYLVAEESPKRNKIREILVILYCLSLWKLDFFKRNSATIFQGLIRIIIIRFVS